MRVEIRNIRNGRDNLAGVLRLQGERIVPEPDIRLLRNILAEPAFDRAENCVYDATVDPRGFLRALHQQYTSAYLRASEVLNDDGGEAAPPRHVRADDYLESEGA